MSERSENRPGERLLSLDAYRGFVMLAMASGGLALVHVADPNLESHPSWLWDLLVFHTQHVVWRGGSAWDLIQPSFMFIVGAAMPFADEARRAKGEAWSTRFGHALRRSLILVALGVFLESNKTVGTHFIFVNVLAQIGLGYWVVFLLLDQKPVIQLGAIVLILVAYWGVFAAYPIGPRVQNDQAALGRTDDWSFLPGFLGHWEKNSNAASAFDRHFLNLFPRPEGKPFTINAGGYATLNFIPSIATMLLGVLAGRWVGSRYTGGSKVLGLTLAGAGCLMLGMGLDETICPIVKRVWSPGWVFWSTAWTCWLLALFYGVVEVWGFRKWAFPLVVVGANSIAVYLMSLLIAGWIGHTLELHTATLTRAVLPKLGISRPTELFGDYQPVAKSAATLLALWLISFWMYRRKIFLKV